MHNLPVTNWGLRTATENALLKAGVNDYFDFVKMYLATGKTLRCAHGIGYSRMREIEDRLDDLKLRHSLGSKEELVLFFAEPQKRPQLAVDLVTQSQNGKDRLASLNNALNCLNEYEKIAILAKFAWKRTVTARRFGCSVRKLQELERSAIRKMRQLLAHPEEDSIPIEMLGLSMRAHNILKRNDIDTVNDIMAADLANIYGLGACTEREIINAIAKLGYHKKSILRY